MATKYIDVQHIRFVLFDLLKVQGLNRFDYHLEYDWENIEAVK